MFGVRRIKDAQVAPHLEYQVRTCIGRGAITWYQSMILENLIVLSVMLVDKSLSYFVGISRSRYATKARKRCKKWVKINY